MKIRFKIPAEKITIPLAIILAGFVALFSALEISLRMISRSFDNRFLTSVKAADGADIAILCLGDSYTVGGQGNFEDSYPKILEEKLNSAYPRKYKVFNGGVCESNSTQALLRLKKIIALRHIDHVILGVGSANRFNLVGYNLYKNKKRAFGEELRVYKMARILFTNIKGSILKFQAARFFERRPAYTDAQTNLFKTTANGPMAPSGPDNSPYRMALKYMEQNDYAKAEAILKQAVNKDSANDGLAGHLGRFYARRLRFTEAEAIFRKRIERSPKNYTHYLDLADCYQNHHNYSLLESNFMPGDELLPIQGQPYYMITDENSGAPVPDKIENLLKKAVELAPGNKLPRIKLAGFYAITSRNMEAKAILRDIRKKWPGSYDACIAFSELYKSWRTLEPEREMLNAACGSFRNVPDTTLADIYEGTGEYAKMRPGEEMLEWLDGIRANPRNFHTYYFVSKAYELQNKFNAGQVLAVLEEVKRNDPDIMKNSTFIHYCSFFSDREKWEKKLYEWLANDLDEIAELCSKAGINLIIQNYPYPYYAVNKTLKRASEKHGLLFVDNQSIFDELTRKNYRGQYFNDDDHCTALGHRIISDNIIRAMKDGNLIAAGHAAAN